MKFPESRSGIAFSISWVLIGALTVVFVAYLWVAMFNNFFDLHSVIYDNEVKRHAINIGQVLLSSDKLVQEESLSDGSKRYHRAVFDASKLDSQMATDPASAGKASVLSQEIGYPRTGAQVVVTDLQTDRDWVLISVGPNFDNTGTAVGCIASGVTGSVFHTVANSLWLGWAFPWDAWDMKTCLSNVAGKAGVYTQSFPLLVYENGQYHPGRMFVRITEY
jgi:hypothetical protein